MFVCCDCCVLSGRGLCDKLITRLEESYRLWCVVVCDLENHKNEEVMTRVGSQRHSKKRKCYKYNNIFIVRVCVFNTPDARCNQYVLQTCYTQSCKPRNRTVPFIFLLFSWGFIPISRGTVWTTYSWYLGLTTFTSVHIYKLYIIT
jgi:hypothetical protein